jgi:hypothetical protein
MLGLKKIKLTSKNGECYSGKSCCVILDWMDVFPSRCITAKLHIISGNKAPPVIACTLKNDGSKIATTMGAVLWICATKRLTSTI